VSASSADQQRRLAQEGTSSVTLVTSAPPGASPRLPGQATRSVRALRCWLLAYRRTWRSTIWSSVFGPLFYLGALGYGLGSLVDSTGTAALGGVRYAVFVAPAVLAVQAMNTGMSSALFPVFSAVHWNRIYIAARATLLSPGDIYRGHLLFMGLRVALNSACFVVFMAVLGLIDSAWAVLLVPAATLLGFAFASVTAAWAVTLDHETAMNYPVRFGAIPLMLFSGTFFPVSRLPGWAQPLAYATPLWHGVALCRGLSLGDLDAGSAALHVGYLAAVTALGLWLGARAYRRRLYV
jgi:lipooligosaccharide transport system permease protein